MATNPHIVGYQCAGTIIEVGEGVTDRFVGQRVVATGLWGSHAAMIAAPSVITWVIPEGADLVKCACVPVAFGTAARLPVRVRPPEVGRDRADPGGRGRRRRRRDPAREARGRDRDRDRVEPRPPRAAEGARPRSRGRLLEVGLGRRGARASPAAAASISSSTPSAARCSRAACSASRTADVRSPSAARAAIRSRSTSRCSRWATSRSPACSSAPRSSTRGPTR